MIKNYRKKPVIIEAIQFDGNNFIECKEFLKGNFDNTLNYPNIKTLNGIVFIEPFEFICKGIANEFYPCKPDIFSMTYEEVKD